MSAITIRAARPGDARRIARLDVETWRAAYAGILTTPFLVGLSARRREVGWATVIEREPRDVRVAVDGDGEIVGFRSCGRNRDSPEHAGEVFTLYVAPDWRRRGVGRSLVERFEPDLATAQGYWVEAAVPETNLPMQLLLRSAGYKAVRVLRRYYGYEDAYLMEHFRS